MPRLKDKVCVITGSGNGIGKAIAELFAKEGAKVVCSSRRACNGQPVSDRLNAQGYETIFVTCDISKEEDVKHLFDVAMETYGRVDVLVNNAPPLFMGIDACSYEDFQRSLAIGVTAPFYLSKLFAPHFAPGASIINISSSRDRMSQPQTESYTAAKGGIAALTHALAVSFAGKVRVNSVSPGWIDNDFTVYEGPDATQQPVGRVGDPMDVANLVLFLASPKAGFITGENICVDGGQTRLMIYHGDHGWTLQ